MKSLVVAALAVIARCTESELVLNEVLGPLLHGVDLADLVSQSKEV